LKGDPMSSDEKKTILVVDDEPDVQVYLQTLLEDNGYDVVVAQDGAVALEKVQESRPDLVTLDITMPEKSGVRFYRDVKENDDLKTIPIVIVTGITKDFEKFISTRKQDPPPDGYVSKPIDREEILDLVKKLA
jgi:two-component system phosphate regulon response regulator PhoB